MIRLVHTKIIIQIFRILILTWLGYSRKQDGIMSLLLSNMATCLPARYPLITSNPLLDANNRLKRMYQQLLTANPPSSPPTFSQHYFSSISSGPGVAKAPTASSVILSEQGIPFPKSFSKKRKYTDDIAYKGLKYAAGDWVHLSNPDDPTKPIVGQVFKTWVSDERSYP